MVERAVVEEEEKIKDTREFAAADRAKQVAVTQAEMQAQQDLVKEVKAAEAAKQSAELHAEQVVVEAEAERNASEKQTQAKKMLAEAKTAEAAATGLAEAQVMQVKADAIEKQGVVEAIVLQRKAEAEAQGLAAKAEATEKQGAAEAKVLELKFSADAQGITQKAEAMKLLDGVGRDHEEFKLRLQKEKEIEIAAIEAQRDIAGHQAALVGESLKSAHIDIVGGDTNFFDKIVSSISNGKSVDRMLHNSQVLSDIKQTFFNGNPQYFEDKLSEFTQRFGVDAEDVKNLSIAALIARLISKADDEGSKQELQHLLDLAQQTGVSKSLVGNLNLSATAGT